MMNSIKFMVLSTLLLTACVSKEFKMNNDHPNPYHLEFSSEDYSVIQKTTKKIHFNPTPKKVYEVILTIKDSPMPLFPSKEPTVTYDSDCQYTVGFIPLYHLEPLTQYKVPIERINENTYKLIYIQDAILDEDYGLKFEGKRAGICHWIARGLGVSFTPTGKPQYFNIVVEAVNDTETLSEQLQYYPIKTYYFEKKHIATQPRPLHDDGTPYNSIGFSGKSREELSHIPDKDLFTVTVSIKKIIE